MALQKSKFAMRRITAINYVDLTVIHVLRY